MIWSEFAVILDQNHLSYLTYIMLLKEKSLISSNVIRDNYIYLVWFSPFFYLYSILYILCNDIIRQPYLMYLLFFNE